MKHSILFLISIFFIACNSHKKTETPVTGTPVEIKYAKGFTIRALGDDARLVEVNYPYQGATSGYKYLLVKRGSTVPSGYADAKVIETPINSIVCTSTSHIPMLDYINETDKLAGFPTLDYISSVKMRQRIDAGLVKELGVDKEMNIELIAALKPGVVMGYMVTSDYGQFQKIEEFGIPVVLNAEYLEKHPLGRAEWIRFVALLFGKEAMADSVFSEIEKEYLQTRQVTEHVAVRPTVLSGIVYGNGWFLPGGQNYASRLLNDAGCDYIWKDDPSHGFLQLSFETVYEKAHQANLWIGVGSYNSLKEIKDADQRYAKFDAFKSGNVYTYNLRTGAKGGNEFMELGYLRPDIVLKDLVKIAHPGLLPSYTLYFHEKLK